MWNLLTKKKNNNLSQHIIFLSKYLFGKLYLLYDSCSTNEKINVL